MAQQPPRASGSPARPTRRRLLQLVTGVAVAIPAATVLLVLTRRSGATTDVVVSTPTAAGAPTGSPTGSPSGTPERLAMQPTSQPAVSSTASTPTREPAASATPRTAATAASIELRPPQVGNGEAMRIRATLPGAATASARFRGVDYQMLPQPDGSFWTVVGAPVDQPPSAAVPVTVTGRTAAGQVAWTVNQSCAVVAVDRPVDYLVASEAATAVLTPDAGAREESLRAQQFAAYDRVPVWKALLQRPCPGDITTHFGQGRSINGGPVGGFHTGVDLADGEGTPVRAAAPGRVAWAGPMPIRGNSVLVDHGGGVKTGYHHLSAIEVEAGDAVEAGKQLGLVGMTGFSTGPHLHWELTVWGVNVDPITWLAQPFSPGS